MKLKERREWPTSIRTSPCANGHEALAFYEKVFLTVMDDDGERLAHARFTIEDAVIMITGDFPELPTGTRPPDLIGGTPVTIRLHLDTRGAIDRIFERCPEFWVQTPIDESAATTGNGTHFGFTASSKEAVQAFYDAAIAAGATDDGQPGPRPLYGEPYYGCFVHDPDSHKIEATFWDMVLAEKLGMA